ncbi:MAG: sodium ion-translocating decarboxylase subunit beta, partial [Pseudomonadales bacterium]|nr:sodium ion-translocating decarboxylase subunit beta [Pseudomonadales bacterium]
MEQLTALWDTTGIAQLHLDQAFMIGIGLVLLYLAISKRFEPLLLVPIGFGGILSNVPGVDIAVGQGILHQFYMMGIETGVFPLVIFMGVGALTDFGPLLANPKTLFLGAAAQFGIFSTLRGAIAMTQTGYFDFTIAEAAAIGIIGGA